jgi:hypothetical protein
MYSLAVVTLALVWWKLLFSSGPPIHLAMPSFWRPTEASIASAFFLCLLLWSAWLLALGAYWLSLRFARGREKEGHGGGAPPTSRDGSLFDKWLDG